MIKTNPRKIRNRKHALMKSDLRTLQMGTPFPDRSLNLGGIPPRTLNREAGKIRIRDRLGSGWFSLEPSDPLRPSLCPGHLSLRERTGTGHLVGLLLELRDRAHRK